MRYREVRGRGAYHHRLGRGGAQPRDPFAVNVERALEVLRLAWGDAYDIRFEGGNWAAVSRDAERCVFSVHTPDELNRAIRADWAWKGTL